MKRKTLVIALLAAAAIVGGALYFRGAPPEAPTEAVVQKPSAEPGVLRFPTAAPQLSQLKVERAELAPVPMDEPLAARVAYDENATARLFAPIPGRVVEIRANIGDTVKAGAVLAVASYTCRVPLGEVLEGPMPTEPVSVTVTRAVLFVKTCNGWLVWVPNSA